MAEQLNSETAKRYKAERGKLKVGSKVEVYSDSQKKWAKGKIIKIFNDNEGEWLQVKYSGFKLKEIQRFNEYLRPIIQQKQKNKQKQNKKQNKMKKGFFMDKEDDDDDQDNDVIFPDPLITLQNKHKLDKMRKERNIYNVKFKKYRKNINDLVAPSGELLAFGYIRENNKIEIPKEISLYCSQFVDLYLNESSAFIKIEQDDDEEKKENDDHLDDDDDEIKRCSLKIMKSNEWESINDFDKRLLRDRLIFDSKQDLYHIECEIKSKNFGLNGISWFVPIIKNCANLSYINLSNCYLNDDSIQCITNSIKQNPNKAPLKWLDVSDNKDVTDKSMENIISIIDRLNGFNLNCTGITDKACNLLSEYFKSNQNIFDQLLVIKLNDNKNGITENGKKILKPFQSKVILVMD